MKKVYFILFGIISIISFHCQKEVSYVGQNSSGSLSLAGEVTIQGNIVDEAGQPIAGTFIRSGDKTTTTDARGYFRIAGSLDDRGVSLVTAEKDGYFKGYRSFIATAGVNQVMLKLVMRDLSGIINSTTGGDVSLSNGSKISLPATGIIKSSGEAYSGAVNVYASYIDPSARDISQIVPGSLMATDNSNKRVVLKSYGMLVVELESSVGEKLQIAQGSRATLSVPIPSSIQSSAPSAISLWYVDEQTGTWKEEGSAKRSGNNYIGEVKHFSFWNCDIGVPAVTSMTLQSLSGSPLVTEVRLTDARGVQVYGWTDSLGQVSGRVPSNENLLMEIWSYACNDVIYSEQIAPLTEDKDLGVISINNSSSVVNITGKLVNCNNLPVNNGYVMIYHNNLLRYQVVDKSGNFSLSLISCSANQNSLQLIGVDNDAQQQSQTTDIKIEIPETHAGSILTCNNTSAQYINYTLDGKDYSITSSANDSLFGYTYSWPGSSFRTVIQGAKNATDYIYFESSHDNSAGTFPLIRFGAQDFRDSTIVLLQPSTITFTNNPQIPGEFYEGSLTVKFTDQLVTGSATHNVNCSFRVRRQQ
jgi:hypothetical protein